MSFPPISSTSGIGYRTGGGGEEEEEEERPQRKGKSRSPATHTQSQSRAEQRERERESNVEQVVCSRRGPHALLKPKTNLDAPLYSCALWFNTAQILERFEPVLVQLA